MAQAAKRMLTPKGHQRELATGTLAILEASDHAYLEAPPASGKTLALAMVADALPQSTAYYLAHTVDLVDQARREIHSYQSSGVVGKNTAWRFVTRAAYNNLVKRDAFAGADPHASFVDECHIGGVNTGQPKVQFPGIVATSAKVVWISATPWDMDERAMGARDGSTSQLAFDEAFRLGILNDTDIVRVDCSLDLRIRFADDRRALHRAEGDEYHVVGEDAADQHEQLSRIVRDIEDRGLRVSDVPNLVHFRHQLMAELYVSLHRGEKAVFWLPTKQHARDCARHLDGITGIPGYAAAILGEKRDSIEAKESAKRLANWMDPKGATKAVCVVYRLREGFDHPPLAIGVDCAWNPYNHRSAVQKIGRLTRKAKGKGMGHYYYAVDAVTMAGAQSRRIDRRFMRGLGRSWTDLDVELMGDAYEDMGSILNAVGAIHRQRTLPLLDSVELSGKRIRMARSGLFDVLASTGTKGRAPIGFDKLMESAASEALEKLVADIEAGRRDMPDINERGDGNMIRSAVTPSRKTYKPSIRARLIRCGALTPKHDGIRRKVDDLVKDIETGLVKLKSGDPNHRFLFKYVNPTNGTFRPDIRDRLLACGAIASKADKTTERIARQKDVTEEEAKRPLDRAQDIADDLATRFGRKPSTMLAEVKQARKSRRTNHSRPCDDQDMHASTKVPQQREAK